MKLLSLVFGLSLLSTGYGASVRSRNGIEAAAGGKLEVGASGIQSTQDKGDSLDVQGSADKLTSKNYKQEENKSALKGDVSTSNKEINAPEQTVMESALTTKSSNETSQSTLQKSSQEYSNSVKGEVTAEGENELPSSLYSQKVVNKTKDSYQRNESNSQQNSVDYRQALKGSLPAEESSKTKNKLDNTSSLNVQGEINRNAGVETRTGADLALNAGGLISDIVPNVQTSLGAELNAIGSESYDVSQQNAGLEGNMFGGIGLETSASNNAQQNAETSFAGGMDANTAASNNFPQSIDTYNNIEQNFGTSVTGGINGNAVTSNHIPQNFGTPATGGINTNAATSNNHPQNFGTSITGAMNANAATSNNLPQNFGTSAIGAMPANTATSNHIPQNFGISGTGAINANEAATSNQISQDYGSSATGAMNASAATSNHIPHNFGPSVTGGINANAAISNHIPQNFGISGTGAMIANAVTSNHIPHNFGPSATGGINANSATSNNASQNFGTSGTGAMNANAATSNHIPQNIGTSVTGGINANAATYNHIPQNFTISGTGAINANAVTSNNLPQNFGTAATGVMNANAVTSNNLPQNFGTSATGVMNANAATSNYIPQNFGTLATGAINANGATSNNFAQNFGTSVSGGMNVNTIPNNTPQNVGASLSGGFTANLATSNNVPQKLGASAAVATSSVNQRPQNQATSTGLNVGGSFNDGAQSSSTQTGMRGQTMEPLTKAVQLMKVVEVVSNVTSEQIADQANMNSRPVNNAALVQAGVNVNRPSSLGLNAGGYISGNFNPSASSSQGGVAVGVTSSSNTNSRRSLDNLTRIAQLMKVIEVVSNITSDDVMPLMQAAKTSIPIPEVDAEDVANLNDIQDNKLTVGGNANLNTAISSNRPSTTTLNPFVQEGHIPTTASNINGGVFSGANLNQAALSEQARPIITAGGRAQVTNAQSSVSPSLSLTGTTTTTNRPTLQSGLNFNAGIGSNGNVQPITTTQQGVTMASQLQAQPTLTAGGQAQLTNTQSAVNPTLISSGTTTTNNRPTLQGGLNLNGAFGTNGNVQPLAAGQQATTMASQLQAHPTFIAGGQAQVTNTQSTVNPSLSSTGTTTITNRPTLQGGLNFNAGIGSNGSVQPSATGQQSATMATQQQARPTITAGSQAQVTNTQSTVNQTLTSSGTTTTNNRPTLQGGLNLNGTFGTNGNVQPSAAGQQATNVTSQQQAQPTFTAGGQAQVTNTQSTVNPSLSSAGTTTTNNRPPLQGGLNFNAGIGSNGNVQPSATGQQSATMATQQQARPTITAGSQAQVTNTQSTINQTLTSSGTSATNNRPTLQGGINLNGALGSNGSVQPSTTGQQSATMATQQQLQPTFTAGGQAQVTNTQSTVNPSLSSAGTTITNNRPTLQGGLNFNAGIGSNGSVQPSATGQQSATMATQQQARPTITAGSQAQVTNTQSTVNQTLTSSGTTTTNNRPTLQGGLNLNGTFGTNGNVQPSAAGQQATNVTSQQQAQPSVTAGSQAQITSTQAAVKPTLTSSGAMATNNRPTLQGGLNLNGALGNNGNIQNLAAGQQATNVTAQQQAQPTITAASKAQISNTQSAVNPTLTSSGTTTTNNRPSLQGGINLNGALGSNGNIQTLAAGQKATNVTTQQQAQPTVTAASKAQISNTQSAVNPALTSSGTTTTNNRPSLQGVINLNGVLGNNGNVQPTTTAPQATNVTTQQQAQPTATAGSHTEITNIHNSQTTINAGVGLNDASTNEKATKGSESATTGSNLVISQPTVTVGSQATFEADKESSKAVANSGASLSSTLNGGLKSNTTRGANKDDKATKGSEITTSGSTLLVSQPTVNAGSQGSVDTNLQKTNVFANSEASSTTTKENSLTLNGGLKSNATRGANKADKKTKGSESTTSGSTLLVPQPTVTAGAKASVDTNLQNTKAVANSEASSTTIKENSLTLNGGLKSNATRGANKADKTTKGFESTTSGSTLLVPQPTVTADAKASVDTNLQNTKAVANSEASSTTIKENSLTLNGGLKSNATRGANKVDKKTKGSESTTSGSTLLVPQPTVTTGAKASVDTNLQNTKAVANSEASSTTTKENSLTLNGGLKSNATRGANKADKTTKGSESTTSGSTLLVPQPTVTAGAKASVDTNLQNTKAVANSEASSTTIKENSLTLNGGLKSNATRGANKADKTTKGSESTTSGSTLLVPQPTVTAGAKASVDTNLQNTKAVANSNGSSTNGKQDTGTKIKTQPTITAGGQTELTTNNHNTQSRGSSGLSLSVTPISYVIPTLKGDLGLNALASIRNSTSHHEPVLVAGSRVNGNHKYLLPLESNKNQTSKVTTDLLQSIAPSYFTPVAPIELVLVEGNDGVDSTLGVNGENKIDINSATGQSIGVNAKPSVIATGSANAVASANLRR